MTSPDYSTRSSHDQLHLSDSEFVDLLDGALPDDRARHVAACADCRAHVDAMNAVLTSASDLDVPEPSPLFWDHLSARVRGTIAEEPTPARAWSNAFTTASFRWSAVAAVFALVLGVATWRTTHPAPVDPSSVANQRPSDTSGGTSLAENGTIGDLDTDEAWALVQTLAEDLDPDDIDDAGITARPGSADGVANGLTETERRELVQVIEDAMKSQTRTGSSS